MRLFAWPVMVLLLGLVACGGGDTSSTDQPAAPAISGRLADGLRILTFDPTTSGQAFTVYRGDYVRPVLVGGGSFTLEIPDLEVARTYPVAEGERPYFKVPEAGVYRYRIGEATGTIEAIEYRAAGYREVSAQEAAAFIRSHDPLVLDVRTPREFAAGHLENAALIPVQRLRQRLGEIAAHRTDPVFVYCRTGNRSTVAAKMLGDAGFTHVVNLRRGIVEWSREGLPVVAPER
jgi:rhodanese-related sulfurtransferase